MSNSNFFYYIDSLKISKNWKERFKKIHVVYHGNYGNSKMVNSHFWRFSSEYKNLSNRDKRHFFVNFNIFALLMGPFYYFQKQMFKKGAVLFGIFLPLFLISNFTKWFLIPLFIYCAYYANRDYFIKVVIKDDKTKSSLLSLNDPPDKIFIYETLLKPYNYLPFILTIAAICAYTGYYTYNHIIQNYALQDYLETVPVVCKGSESCQNYILSAVKDISMIKESANVSKRYYLIAAAYLGNNDTYNAINSLNLAIDIDSKNISALYLRAYLFYKEKKYSQAAFDYKEILKIAPGAQFIHFYLGRCFYQLDMYKYASKSFKIAAKKYRKPQFYEYLGYSELKEGNKQEAIKALKTALKLYTKDEKTNNTEKIKFLKNYINSLEKKSP